MAFTQLSRRLTLWITGLAIVLYAALVLVAWSFSDVSSNNKLNFVLVSIIMSAVVAWIAWSLMLSPRSRVSMVGSMSPALVIFVIAVLNIRNGTQWFKSYGDAGELEVLVSAGRPFGRWLLGTTLLVDGYSLLRAFVASVSARDFVLMASAGVMAIASAIARRSFGARAAVVLPLTMPIWIGLSLGYDEYYPFIAGVFLATSLWICTSSAKRPSMLMYSLAGVLPALYVGFIPLGGFVLLKLASSGRGLKEWSRGLLISVATYVLIVEVSWPFGHSNYLSTIADQMSLGNRNNGYRGEALSDKSPFFSLNSVISSWHAKDILFCGLMAGGVSMIIFVIGFVQVFERSNWNLDRVKSLIGVRNPGHLLQHTFVAWSVFYFLFMIPKLGPVTDIDLFFTSNIVIAICAGKLVDRLALRLELGHSIKQLLVALVASFNGPFLAGLLIFGVAR